MKKWEVFEEESTYHINKNYGSVLNVEAISSGGSDSTLNDIHILKNNDIILNVEAKANFAQSGQFVVTIDSDGLFQYGESNFSEINEYVQEILDELNSSEKYLVGVSQNIVVDVPELVSINWIKKYYKSKKVSFFISEYDGEKIIIDINNLERYFSAICTLRPKRSGSSEVSKVRETIFYQGMHEKFPEYNLNREDLFYKGKKLYFKSELNLCNGAKRKETFIIGGEPYRFQIEKTEDNVYYVRNLSTTKNPTIIFTIETISGQRSEDLKSFNQALRGN